MQATVPVIDQSLYTAPNILTTLYALNNRLIIIHKSICENLQRDVNVSKEQEFATVISSVFKEDIETIKREQIKDREYIKEIKSFIKKKDDLDTNVHILAVQKNNDLFVSRKFSSTDILNITDSFKKLEDLYNGLCDENIVMKPKESLTNTSFTYPM